MMKRICLRRAALAICSLFLFCLLAACGDDAFLEQTPEDAAQFKAEMEALNEMILEGASAREIMDAADTLPMMCSRRIVIVRDWAPMLPGKSKDEEDESALIGKWIQNPPSGCGLLLFSRPGCPWCRLLLPTLLEFAAERGIYIYLYDPEAIRAANDDDYKALVAELYDYLPVDTRSQDENSPDFDPTRKRLSIPHLLFLEKGEIMADYRGAQDPMLEAEDEAAIYEMLTEKYATIE